MLRYAMVLALLSAACSSASERPGPEAPPRAAEAGAAVTGDAVAGVTDPGLRKLLFDHWERRLATSPEWATSLGDHRFDTEISDPSDRAHRVELEADRGFLARARALDAEAMDARDRITLRLLVEDLERDLATAACESHLWNVTANGNPLSRASYLPKRHPIKSAADARNLVARYRKIPGAVDAVIANLRAGAARKLVANRESLQRTLALVDGYLAKPVAEWALMEPATVDHPGMTADERASFAAGLRAVVEGDIRPAFQRYRALLADELVPAGRGPDAAGLVALPIGEACYRARIAGYVGLDRTARELHELGLREIESINNEMRDLGVKLFGDGDLAATLERLRTDRSLYFTTRAEVEAKARSSLARARAAMPEFFGILPRTDCVVTPIPDYEAPYTTIAYYRQPHADGSKPGEYYVNTYAPETRPRFEAEVLAYHEAIPGHHLQIAIAQERGELPAFRRHGGHTAFIEGWALYTERLADEMGLYSGDLDRMGMLSYDAWRAARLVVDTGIHAFGWTRARAETFMLEHTALAKNNIRNEVDRYIGNPGQALAYKVGQMWIRDLRARARDRLGDGFDIKRFHDAVLGNGAVSLRVLDEQITAWLEAAAAPR